MTKQIRGKTLVLYRAKEQHLLDLLRDLALSTLVPYLQRLIRGFLARECKRRCLISRGNLKLALETACSVGECDAGRLGNLTNASQSSKKSSMQSPAAARRGQGSHGGAEWKSGHRWAMLGGMSGGRSIPH